MAEILETRIVKKPGFVGSTGFGGRQGSRKTVWLAAIVTVSLVAVGVIYLSPLFW